MPQDAHPPSPNMLRVVPDAQNAAQGWVMWKGRRYPCALGRGVIAAPDKREGDSLTPAGLYPLRWLYYRPDKMDPPETGLDIRPLSAADGWCDAPDHKQYNKPVALPFDASCEELWREDGLYDLILVIGHNDAPARPGLGSAIFFHIAREAFSPTRGCVALAREDLLEIIQDLNPSAMVRIHSG